MASSKPLLRESNLSAVLVKTRCTLMIVLVTEMNVSRLPDEIPFERWVQHVFDHPIVEPQWHFHDGDEFSEDWDSQANPARTLEFLTRLFRAPAFLIGTYTRAQIDQGLSYIVDSSCSNHMFAISDESLPLDDRCACILATSTLYSDLMVAVYGNDLGHLQRDKGDPDRPNFACYMWWDVIPLHGGLEYRDRLNESVLQVFRETLILRSEACLESALHGCGHWQSYHPKQIESIVQYFLNSRDDISPELRRYAELAAIGHVQ